MTNDADKPADTHSRDDRLERLFANTPTTHDKQIQVLQEALAKEKDARNEERFIGIVLLVLLLDIVFFSVMPSFGGPLALLVLELLILIPLAKRMGMEEVAAILSRALDNVAGKSKGEE